VRKRYRGEGGGANVRLRPAFLAFLVVPTAIMVYAIAFLNSIDGLKPDSRRFPLLIISILVPILVLVVVSEYAQERRFVRTSWIPEEAESGDGALLSFAGQIWQRAAHHATVWSTAGATTILLAAYLALMPRMGFYTATILYVAAQSLLLKAGSVVRCVLIGIGVSASCYLLFAVVLGFTVPSGALF
jgi:hypothetical protein